MMDGRLTFWGGTMETTAEEFSLALQTRSGSLIEYMDGGTHLAGEVKKAFDALRVNIVGRPQRPRDNVLALLGWARKNELVFACIEKKSQAAQDPTPVIEVQKKKVWTEVPDHPLAALLRKPNALDDGASFMAAWFASLDIAGRFFAEIVRDPQTGQISALWPLHPGKLFPIPGRGKDGSNIIGWKWKDGELEQDFKPDEILYDRNRDLATHFDAISPLAVALGSVDMDSAQTDYVRAFFNNGGVPSGILRFNNRTLTRPEMEAKRQAWMLRYGRKGVGERGIAVLDQGAEYQKIGSDIKELEADSLRGQGEARICMVFGVPPILVGAYVGLRWVNQRASAREAQEDFWLNTMSPKFKARRSFLTWNLLPYYEPIEAIRRQEVRVGWDMTDVLALKKDADKTSTRAQNEFRSGLITQNEGREMIGQERDPNGDFYLIPSSFNPRTGEILLAIAQKPPAAPPAQEGEADETDADEQGDEADSFGKLAARFLESKRRWALPPAPESGKSFDLDGLRLARAPKSWEAHLNLKAIAGATTKPAAAIKAALMTLRKSLIGQAVEMLADCNPAELHSVVLTPTPRTFKTVREQLNATYKLGRALIDAELARQKPKAAFVPKDFKDIFEDEEEDDEFLEEISGATVSRVVNDVQSRAGGILATLALLAVESSARRARIKIDLEEGSTAYVEHAAASVSNVALNRGRDAEIEARSDEIDRILYSAILDVNTCEVCEAEDGKEAARVEDLAPAPNDECLGGDRCRCFHVAIFESEEEGGGDE